MLELPSSLKPDNTGSQEIVAKKKMRRYTED